MKLTLTTTQQLLCLRKCSIPGYFSPIQHVLWASLFVYKYSTAMLLSWSSVWMEDWKTLHGQFCLNSASHNSRTDTSWSGLRTNTPLFNCFNKWIEGNAFIVADKRYQLPGKRLMAKMTSMLSLLWSWPYSPEFSKSTEFEFVLPWNSLKCKYSRRRSISNTLVTLHWQHSDSWEIAALIDLTL